LGIFKYFWSEEGTDSQKIPDEAAMYYNAGEDKFTGEKKGDPLFYLVLKFKGGKLDGLQPYGRSALNRKKKQFEWINNFYSPAIINGHFLELQPGKKLQSGELGYKFDKSELEDQMGIYKNDLVKFAYTFFWEDLGEKFDFIRNNYNVFEENKYYDLETMVNIFLSDVMATKNQYYFENPIGRYLQKVNLNETPPFSTLSSVSINATFEPLENNVIARAYGIDNDNQIILKVDPEKWMSVNTATRWYILYHELGHDFFNLRHGQGGRMMFNYPTEMYDWVDFFEDRDFMFEYFFTKLDPEYKPPMKTLLR
jgi:hypothetical protein